MTEPVLDQEIAALRHFEHQVDTLQTRVGEAINELAEVKEACQGLGLGNRIGEIIEQLEIANYPLFVVGERVRVFVAGTGLAFTKGVHAVDGEIIKVGVTPNSYHVLLDTSILTDGGQVIEASAFALQSLEEN